MYKLLLCLRYLRTRFIALASIISVMLGVATMIVVNSVMAGFTTEMQDRIHGILSDIEVRSHSMMGFYDPERVMAKIREIAGDDIVSMTPTVEVPAMLSFQFRGEWVTRQVHMVGIDAASKGRTSDYGKYLLHPVNRQKFSFNLREGGFDTHDHQAEPGSPERPALAQAGWDYRRRRVENERLLNEWQEKHSTKETQKPPAAGAKADPFNRRPQEADTFDPARQQHTGIVLGFALATFRAKTGENEGDKFRDNFLVLPGDDVKLTFPTAGTPPRAVDDAFTIVDFYECKMNEYDEKLVFVPLKKLQELRGMIEPTTGIGYVTSIQIKLKDDSRGQIVRDKLLAATVKRTVRGTNGTRIEEHPIFPPEIFGVYTWRDKQGPLLAAVGMETAILNVLLFMIIAVAGFGILAIFFMIVVEKTRDIGILKSLGASSRGIMSIFLAYGLSLGMVGAGVGLALGLLFVAYINDIAKVLSWVTGHEVFDPTIYYFSKIPTIVNPVTVAWIVAGAMFIAVLASILPARRAAGLHPVEALRYE